MPPLVSIVVPIYKVESYLARCVDSLLTQTYKNIEIILVDDGSPDNCPSIADSYAAQHLNIQVIHKANGGISSARKEGWRAAKGEYILFIDSDDYVEPTMVKKLFSAIEEQRAELALCSYFTESDGTKCAHQLAYSQSHIEKTDIVEQYIYPLMGKGESINIPGFLCIRLMKRELIEESYFVSENQYFMEDHVFDLKYADKVNSIAVINEPLYVYCINRASLSNRYRPGKWQMYINLYQYFLNYLAERKLTPPTERLESFIAGGIFACIDNAVLSGSLRSFKQEISHITTFPPAEDLLNIKHHSPYPRSYKLPFLLLHHRLYSILFFIRRLSLARHI
ncbi:MAG: glycosyltransferase family 2 protein [Akkermansia sp.]|nr:glycosyltransferase family 2 protein [Akkermansia sp.]